VTPLAGSVKKSPHRAICTQIERDSEFFIVDKFPQSEIATKADVRELKKDLAKNRSLLQEVLDLKRQEVTRNPLPGFPMKDWYNTEEVAKATKVTYKTVERWCRQGRLLKAEKTASRTWKISRESLEQVSQQGLLPVPNAYRYRG